MIDVPALDTPQLKVHVAQDAAGGVTVGFKGVADTRVMEKLDATLKLLHTAVLGEALREVVVDFRELDFMNSSCFKAILSWLSDVQDLAEEQQYVIHILSDSGKHWQHRSLGALNCFAVGLIRIETT